MSIVALGCFHPVIKVQSASLHFFLGSEEEQEDSDDEEPDFPAGEGKRMTVWSRYLAMHVRKQLAFGTIFSISLSNIY